MITLPLVPESCEARCLYLEQCILPLFYMEDFTLLGFKIREFEIAKNILVEGGYKLTDKGVGIEIHLRGYTEIEGVKKLLDIHQIEADFSDIADTFYQA
ncbi:MAG: hypothetical protein GY702_03450 [Desulfobulbaceae bacterium]|nr:hypothetical protein [Desulfobulbaceae bacterium]